MAGVIDARSAAFSILRDADRSDAHLDRCLDRFLQKNSLKEPDKNLATEIVYGVCRYQRTLDSIIARLGKTGDRQPPDLRRILHIGLYQLRYLSNVPDSAAVNTSVELAKNFGLGKLAGVVNGILRQYIRFLERGEEPLLLPLEPIEKLGCLYSFPDWLVKIWLDKWGLEETEKLCEWFNRTPKIDLRVDTGEIDLETVEKELIEAGIGFTVSGSVPDCLRLEGGIKGLNKLPGFQRGWYSVQDSSAQLVAYFLDPRPGELIIDACAAPGGKTTHIARLMGDKGRIIALDKKASRLKQLEENRERLGLKSIEILTGDSREVGEWEGKADRVLVDAPCSGLGTLHKHPDIRWRQTPDNLVRLARLQGEILANCARWVKPGGILVYSTCTLDPIENEAVIRGFLADNPDWKIEKPAGELFKNYLTPEGTIEPLPHRHDMDGFYMARLIRAR